MPCATCINAQHHRHTLLTTMCMECSRSNDVLSCLPSYAKLNLPNNWHTTCFCCVTDSTLRSFKAHHGNHIHVTTTTSHMRQHMVVTRIYEATTLILSCSTHAQSKSQLPHGLQHHTRCLQRPCTPSRHSNKRLAKRVSYMLHTSIPRYKFPQ